MNAVLNKISANLKGCRLFTTHYPCSRCAGLLIQSGVRQVYYLYDNPDSISAVATTRMFNMCGVAYERYVPERSSITLVLK